MYADHIPKWEQIVLLQLAPPSGVYLVLYCIDLHQLYLCDLWEILFGSVKEKYSFFWGGEVFLGHKICSEYTLLIPLYLFSTFLLSLSLPLVPLSFCT